MNSADQLRGELQLAFANQEFSEAALEFGDGSKLYFCHRVGERWAKAHGRDGSESHTGLAGSLLAKIEMFRLNAKHLDVRFRDGSRWDEMVPFVANR